jgi:UDP-glucose:(heptosyl)LPS alpha-1,3-glucosyltransferase
MKIGLVRRGYSSSGGAEAYLRRFADAARAAGHECVLFATDDWPESAWTHPRVRLAGKSPRAFADSLEVARPREHCDFLLSLERVWRCDAYRAGDGVHAAWLARRAKYEPFWQPFVRRFNAKHKALLEIERALFGPSGARLVIANSALVKREIMEHFAFPSERIHVVHNGVPPMPPIDREGARTELGFGPADYVVLFVGSGWERKGLRFAIEAMNVAQLTHSTLLVAGRGNPKTMPRSDRVRYLGPVREVPRLLAAADAFILPTLYDPFSNACLEALAAGLPVITTAHNGFAEIIEPGVEGEVIAEPADLAALARAIERWAAPDRRAAVRTRLLAKGARFSIEENVRCTLAIIEEAAQTARP